MAKIAVIDDDALMRALLSRFLEARGHRTVSFANPDQALAAILDDHFSLILSDVRMPRISGLQLVEELRKRGSRVPVVLLTAEPHVLGEREARKLGISRILRKPLRGMSRLDEAIRETLGDEPPAEDSLDRLKLKFITDLSHELRTPLTALQLALDSLDETAISSPEAARLVGIGRRNINRILAVVETELGLLQTVLGELFVARKLVDVSLLVDESLRRSRTPSRVSMKRRSSPVWSFSDPDLLRSLFGFLLGSRHLGPVRGVEVGYEPRGEEVQVSFRFAPPEGGTMPEASDLERRACRAIAKALAGQLRLIDGGRPEVRLSLPVLPPFDRTKDLVNPLKTLRKTGELACEDTALLRCILSPREGSQSQIDSFQPFTEFVTRADALVRGHSRDVYYFALLGGGKERLEVVTRGLRKRQIEVDVLRLASWEAEIDGWGVWTFVDKLD